MPRKPFDVIVPRILLVTLLLGLGQPSRGGQSQLLPVTGPLIRRYSEQVAALLMKGDLRGARSAALKAWEAAKIQPLFPANGEPPAYAYLFPEGEALRFFVWERYTRITYVEIERGTITPLWAVHLAAGTRPLPSDDTFSSYLNRNPYIKELGVSAEIGKRPKFEQSLVFFRWNPLGTFVDFGRIARDGHVSDYGSIEATSPQLAKKGLPLKIEGEKIAAHRA